MNDVPAHWERVLQAIAHWIAYKKQYFDGHLLTEGAIVAELTQLLSAKISTNQKIECEKMYKDICSAIENNSRADIVIGNRPREKRKKYKLDAKDITEVIEVKRDGDFDEILKDFEKLGRLKDKDPHMRLFQVIVGQRQVPEKLFSDNNNLCTKNIYDGFHKIEARPRMSKKAFGTKRTSQNGVFAVLVEII